MKHFRKVNTNKISWLNIKNAAGGGIINDLYYPESISELVEIVRECQSSRRDYYVFGHTSNSYFLPGFSPDVVILILYLKGYYLLLYVLQMAILFLIWFCMSLFYFRFRHNRNLWI